MEKFAQHAYERYATGAPVLAHLPMLVQFNVNSALTRNAEMLCMVEEYFVCDSISRFNKQGPESVVLSQILKDWPASLHPTPLQLTVEHHPWIDVFPSPRMRDNILRVLDCMEECDEIEDELCRDLCQYGDPAEKATLMVWGNPWDPRSWEATPAFLKKWGFLLFGCIDMIQATNYWRLKRGEEKLSLKDIANAMIESRPMELANFGI